ncbi:MAG: hypothetical protein COV44_06070 [Deltaproteobacteria bacterium CG11_big_fil_rev_8_21_14_0_20_45_16]|nr:MAG: hypothetical protein COV44_06070 [Deltaproteobacteria bacterium CG11_big_fil_rev_8_21_14_0_20_45_16]
MDLVEQARLLVERLREERLLFALAGGLASSTYRKNKRTTDDLDFLIYSETSSEGAARKILTDFNLQIREARKANLEGGPKHVVRRKSSPLYILVGRKEGHVGIDFILPAMPWFQKALDRAQSNVLKFGSLEIPCLTLEDMIIAKFYSLSNDSTRFADADDIKAIFESQPKADLGYIVSQMIALEIEVPLSVEKLVPSQLVKASKKIRKAFLNRKA